MLHQLHSNYYPLPQLFQFESLVGFSLTTKRHRPEWLDDGTWNLLSKLPTITFGYILY